MAVRAKKTESEKKPATKERAVMREVIYTRKLNVRSEPKITAPVIAIVSEGERFKEIKDKSTKEWLCIKVGSDELVGYALKSYLK